MTAAAVPVRLDAGVRRVVTGVDGRGKAVVVADDRVRGDPRALSIWAADAPPRAGDASAPAASGWWPPPGGVRVMLSTRRPDRDDPLVPRPAQHWPDINDAAGFHATMSADIVIMLSGTIWLELDDGVAVALEAGDTLVQNGTRHRWRNHGDDWPIMAVIIVGADPQGGRLPD